MRCQLHVFFSFVSLCSLASGLCMSCTINVSTHFISLSLSLLYIYISLEELRNRARKGRIGYTGLRIGWLALQRFLLLFFIFLVSFSLHFFLSFLFLSHFMCITFERFQARYQAVAFFTSDSVWGGGVGTLHRSTCLWEMAFTGQNQVSSTVQVDLFEIANIIFFHKCHFSNLCTGEWWEMPRSRHHYACDSRTGYRICPGQGSTVSHLSSPSTSPNGCAAAACVFPMSRAQLRMS